MAGSSCFCAFWLALKWLFISLVYLSSLAVKFLRMLISFVALVWLHFRFLPHGLFPSPQQSVGLGGTEMSPVDLRLTSPIAAVLLVEDPSDLSSMPKRFVYWGFLGVRSITILQKFFLFKFPPRVGHYFGPIWSSGRSPLLPSRHRAVV